jgi:hypothetical protein
MDITDSNHKTIRMALASALFRQFAICSKLFDIAG